MRKEYFILYGTKTNPALWAKTFDHYPTDGEINFFIDGTGGEIKNAVLFEENEKTGEIRRVCRIL